jgi:hypothetical protein
MHQLDV